MAAESSPVGWWAQFEDAVRCMFSEWTALRLAAENLWGGPASADKAAELAAEVLARFRRPRDASASWHAPYADELEDLFDDWMQNELLVLVEDGSIEEVAALVVRVHEECQHGDFRTAMRICARTRSVAARATSASRKATAAAEMAPAQRSSNRAARAAQAMAGYKPPEDEGGDDGGGEKEGKEVGEERRGAGGDVVVADEAPQPKPRRKPEVDAEGWQVVGPGKRGQRLVSK